MRNLTGIKNDLGDNESGKSVDGESSTLLMGRIVGLDVLRAIAILLVLVFHGPSVPYILKPIMNFGWVGVDLFFVLSGYLIGGILLKDIEKTGTINLVRFFTRRGFKIWPSYYAFVLVWAILYSRRHLWVLIPNVFHLQNYFPNAIPHTWSLAVEEHFYILLPLVMLGFLKNHRRDFFRSLMILWIVLVVLCLVMRMTYGYVNWSYGSSVVTKLQWQTQFRIDSLMGGVFLAAIKMYVKSTDILVVIKRNARMVLVIGGLLSIPLFFMEQSSTLYIMMIWPTILQLTFMSCLWIFKDLNIRKDSVVLNYFLKCLILIAKISYNVYLWHWFILAVLDSQIFVRLGLKANFYVYFILSLFLGWVMTTFIEKPFLKMRDKFA